MQHGSLPKEIYNFLEKGEYEWSRIPFTRGGIRFATKNTDFSLYCNPFNCVEYSSSTNPILKPLHHGHFLSNKEYESICSCLTVPISEHLVELKGVSLRDTKKAKSSSKLFLGNEVPYFLINNEFMYARLKKITSLSSIINEMEVSLSYIKNS